MMIKASAYAKAHGKTPRTILVLIQSGKLPATRSGSRWYIDSDTPYPTDERVKHGAYIGIRDKIK